MAGEGSRGGCSQRGSHPDAHPRLEAAEARKKQSEQREQTEQMETEKLEGEPTMVEVMMETSKMDTMCDWHALPPAESALEEAYHQHLLEKEDDEAVWNLAALRYLKRIDEEIWLKHLAKVETGLVGKCYPRLWAYWAIKGLLMPSEEYDFVIDPNKPLKDRIHAAEKQCTVRYAGMSKAALEDRLAAITVKLPPRIQYQQGLAEIMFATGYNETKFWKMK